MRLPATRVSNATNAEARRGSSARRCCLTRPSHPVPNAAANAARIGSHAIGPVHSNATVGNGTGHHGIVVSSAGTAVTGNRRHPGTRPAHTIAATSTHHGAGATRRAASVADTTDTVPIAHQMAAPTHTGAINWLRRVGYNPDIRHTF